MSGTHVWVLAEHAGAFVAKQGDEVGKEEVDSPSALAIRNAYDHDGLVVHGPEDDIVQLVGVLLGLVAPGVSVVADTPAAAHAVEQLRVGQERAMV